MATFKNIVNVDRIPLTLGPYTLPASKVANALPAPILVDIDNDAVKRDLARFAGRYQVMEEAKNPQAEVVGIQSPVVQSDQSVRLLVEPGPRTAKTLGKVRMTFAFEEGSVEYTPNSTEAAWRPEGITIDDEQLTGKVIRSISVWHNNGVNTRVIDNFEPIPVGPQPLRPTLIGWRAFIDDDGEPALEITGDQFGEEEGEVELEMEILPSEAASPDPALEAPPVPDEEPA